MSGIPLASPLYPEPPIEYRDAVMLVALVDGVLPASHLPPGLEAGAASMLVVVFADYPDTTIGPYREVVVLAPVLHADTPGLFCPLIYVTDDAALCAGREVWGFPKKLAHIDLGVGEGAVTARLGRRGAVLLSIEGRADEAADPAAIGAIGDQPIINHKRIPGVAGKEPDVDQLTAVRLETATKEASTGAGTLRASGEVADVLGAGGPVTLLRSVADLVLPAGETVH